MEDAMDTEHVCASQLSHFDHVDEFMSNLDIILTATCIKQSTRALERLMTILDYYQEQSHLLDPSLETMIEPVMKRLRKDIDQGQTDLTLVLFRFLYFLTKTRGFKTIVKFMSHEVTDLEPVFEYLSGLDSVSSDLWEARYICFIWLSLICMIPFDLKKVDSGTGTQDSLIVKMLNLCKRYICTTGKERDGASLLIARLLSRQDLCHEYLIPFIDWSKQRLSADADVFEVTGILQSLCITYQLSPRTVLLPTLDDTIVPLLSMPFFDQYANNALVRKLRTKLTQRVGLCYLKPKIATWRYQRGNRSLRQNLEGIVSSGLVSAKPLRNAEDEEDEDEEDISENLEVIIEILLHGLRDKDTIVRWSAAKGIGRITQRLPQELAEDVVGSLLELFEENTFLNKENELDLSAVSDHTWHGASLAIAELARRGLLLPNRLEETIPWILKGLKFDLKRGSHSIGSHVRDACCYVCWAFARAYAPNILEPFVSEIAQNLVVVSLFDREINVRRASSAAFQENVGRQGIFPHGIEIIQNADYFSLGNRNNAFLSISFDIAKFEEYRYHLIHHLISVTAKHWDKAMRLLASKALYGLVSLDPVYFLEKALPYLIPNATSKDMQVSHGALLAIAEISLALYQTSNADILNRYHQKTPLLTAIVANIPPKSLTTFGSEHVREGVCHLITCLSTTQLNAGTDLSVWKHVVQTSLERKEENVQEYAVLSFGAIAKYYGLERVEFYHALKKVEVDHTVVRARRSYALGLGTIEYIKHKDCVHDVLVQLCKASLYRDDILENDALAKRNAVIGLTSILKNLGDELKAVVTYDDFQLVLNTLSSCLTDYSTDQRGDVGSWVRIASMELLNYLLPCIARLDRLDGTQQPKYLSATSTSDFMAALLKQSVERIDKVRSSAGNVLCDLVCLDTYLEFAGHDCLRHYIKEDLSWSTPSQLYPVMVQLLKIPEYRFELLTGLIASAGGLTESLVRHSSSCLTEYMDGLPITEPSDPSLQDIFSTLLDIFTKYEKEDRVSIPLLDVFGLLYESGTLPKITNHAMHLKLFTLLKKETFKCRNVRKLLSAIKVFIGFMSIQDSQVKTKSIQQMLSYLVHAFPRVSYVYK
ncbi:armadillo-type protein [Helicostylum pulchrum]|nr:armadillo-type protein [Helicostylum pulchrum]